MRIGAFGVGYVGTVSAACLSERGHDVVCVDTNQDRFDLLQQGKSPIAEESVQGRLELAKEDT
jgi:UDP-glucose 6-dehydrogenase